MANYVTLVIAISTCFIGVITSIIAYSQMKIASAKVKLDLYERRFSVYVAALNFYQALGKIQPEEIVKSACELIKASREAKFLFKEDDGIQEILDEMQSNSEKILIHINQLNIYGVASPGFLILLSDIFPKRSQKFQADFKENLKNLEEKIKPYIQFGNVKG